MKKPQSNAKQLFIGSASKIDVRALYDKHSQIVDRLTLYNAILPPDEVLALSQHLQTIETILTALGAPIPQ